LRRFLSILILLTISISLSADNNYIPLIRESLRSAENNYPTGWIYEESAGALGIYQFKDHTCSISSGNNQKNRIATIISSSEDHERANSTDPRNPIKSGDTFEFSMETLFAPINPFRAVNNSLEIYDEGIYKEVETDYQRFTVKYITVEQETGNQVRMEGEINMSSEGALLEMTIRQLDIGKKEKEKYWIVYFNESISNSVDDSKSCKLEKIEFVSVGKFLIFNYVFNSSTRYLY
jgi:hypothetical protein